MQFISIRSHMNEITEKTIDIDKVLADKMGKKSKLVPWFVKGWLRRTIHQDEVNKFLWESRDKKGVEWLEECVRYLDMTLDIVGEENLPAKDDGRLYTFVSNHPLGGEDGVALGAIIGRHYDGNFKYLVNDLLMNLPGLAPLCIPITCMTLLLLFNNIIGAPDAPLSVSISCSNSKFSILTTLPLAHDASSLDG